MNTKSSRNTKLFLSLIGVAFVGGVAGPLAKYALQEIPPLGYSFVRLILGSLFLLVTLHVIEGPPKWSSFKLFAPVATFWWLNALIFTFGLKLTNATTAQFIHMTVPVITALLAIMLLKERLSVKQWLGSVVALSGVCIIVLSKGSLSFHNQAFLGNLLILASAVVFSLYGVLSKSKKYAKISPTEMVFIATACGAIAGLAPALLEYQNNPWLSHVHPLSYVAMVVATASISFFYLGFQRLIKTHGPSIASTNLYLLPIFVAMWAYVFLGEVISGMVAIGAIMSVIGVRIVASRRRT